MKNSTLMMSISIFAGVLAMIFNSPRTPQQNAPAASPAPPTASYPAPFVTTRSMSHEFPVPAEESISGMAKALQEASADEKEEIEAKIRTELESQYDEFLARNEEQIERLQQRIDRLKDQLTRRRRAKSKLVDLEFERVVNEADGLVWPDRGSGMFHYHEFGKDPFANQNFRGINLRRPSRPRDSAPEPLREPRQSR